MPRICVCMQHGARPVDVGYSVRAAVPLGCYIMSSCCCLSIPPYVFDNETAWLETQYTCPPAFVGQHDLFEACENLAEPQATTGEVPQRPRYKWVLIGAAGTGGRIHTDHCGTSAWNALVAGRKRWCFFPPETPSDILEDLPEGHRDERSAVWYATKYEAAVRMAEAAGFQPLEVVQERGEVMYIPRCAWPFVLLLLLPMM
jgi:hypothetical protein